MPVTGAVQEVDQIEDLADPADPWRGADSGQDPQVVASGPTGAATVQLTTAVPVASPRG